MITILMYMNTTKSTNMITLAQYINTIVYIKMTWYYHCNTIIRWYPKVHHFLRIPWYFHRKHFTLIVDTMIYHVSEWLSYWRTILTCQKLLLLIIIIPLSYNGSTMVFFKYPEVPCKCHGTYISVALYFKVPLLQCNYTFKNRVIVINYMYLSYGYG